MADLVQFSTHGDVGVITIKNPPVNALSPGVPEGIAAGVEQINADPNLRVGVVIGDGGTFIAGADIKEFQKMTAGKAPRIALNEWLAKIEDSKKPIVAAIDGNALGGGLELAMACHYRVIAPSARVGQPEVNLGIIPGAGGTQRLPRLAGVAKAIEMCTGGKPVKAADAAQAGIVDRVIEGDLLEAAVAFARDAAPKAAVRTRDRQEKLRSNNANAALFAAARAEIEKRNRNPFAPLRALAAIEAATKLPFDEGLKREAELFDECLYSEQSKALIHIFFAEREVSKIPDVPKETPTLPVKTVAIVGAGTMGGGIAMACANAGLSVVLKDTDYTALDRGVATIEKNYATSVKSGRFTPQQAAERLAAIRTTLEYADFASADLVIEAVFENMALKKEVFAQLDQVAKKGAMLATNTSTLDVDTIAGATSRPESVIGLHFFSPANVMRLLEVVRGKKTRKEMIATAMQLGKKIGKVAVLAGNCWGFVGNRMFMPYMNEAQFLVEEGAAPEAVDKVLFDWGMAMGPLAVADMAGVDVGERVRGEAKHLRIPGDREPLVEAQLVKMGRLGQKANAGWYKYDAARKAIPDPEVVQLARELAAKAGIAQRQISAEEILDRCIYALVNAGARVLEEGCALRPGDIDIVYVNGYGFPAFRGGPMWYADTVGVKRVYERIEQLHDEHGKCWEPAALLKTLAEEGGTFAEWERQRA